MPDSLHGRLNAAIAAVKPADTMMSADGSTLYVAGLDGKVRVYDVATRTLQVTWDVGVQLGGMDISPNGDFLMVVERQPLATTPGNGPHDQTTTVTVYKIDIATGAKTSFPITMVGSGGVFFDIAVGADGNAILGQSFRNVTGSGPLIWRLDVDSGQYTRLDERYTAQDVMLWRNEDGTEILIGVSNSSDAPLYIYEPGTGFTDVHNNYEDGVTGSALGTSAISSAAGLVAQFAGKLHIYDTDLNHQFELSALLPQFSGSGIVGLAFDGAGTNLYVLDQRTDTISQISTADWSLVRTFAVGADVDDASEFAPDGDYGNQLIVTPDGRYFTVVTGSGLWLVENDSFANNFTGSAIGDNLDSAAGDDRLFGLGGNDQLRGGAGNDVLDGGAGTDTMTGGTGDDWYYVTGGDTVIEGAAEGTLDRVFASTSYTLTAGAYIEKMSTDDHAGTAAIDLTGNELDNLIYGNAGDNRLDGRVGADAMIGWGGNDWYFVDNAGDYIGGEGASDGTGDRVFASTSFTLSAGAYIEKMSTDDHAGTAAIDLTGNELDNLIYGNAGDNRLDGRAGADAMIGWGGNDWYFVDNAGDYIGGEGASDGNGDRVFASASFTLSAGAHIENMSTDFHAGTAAINLTGNELGNLIYGNAGANVVDGKGGGDFLFGFGGADTFAVTTALGAGNVDTILDFDADDTIALDDAVFAGLGLGALSAGAFVSGTQAATADHRIVYDQATGQLFYDADGNGAGAQVLFATLLGAPVLTANDFVVI